MFAAFKVHPLAAVNKQPVFNLATLAGHIPAQHFLPHLQKDFVHAKRIVLCDLLCLVKIDPGQRFYNVAFQEEIMCFLSIIQPPFDPEIIHKLWLDLVNRAVVLPGEGPVAAFDRASLDDPGSGAI